MGADCIHTLPCHGIIIMFIENDKYCETDNFITWKRDEAVKIKYGDKGMESIPAISVVAMVRSTAAKHGKARALGTQLFFPHIFSSFSTNNQFSSANLLFIITSFSH